MKQLQAAAKEHLAEHPEINTTVPRQLFDDAGHELIYTPPYVSQLQPIELIWAFTKSLVARQSSRSRSVDEAAAQTRQAMDQVTTELCQKVINHTHTWMEEFMQSEEGGSLRQFRDLATLKAACEAMHKAAANDVAYTTWVPQSAEEQDDAHWAS